MMFKKNKTTMLLILYLLGLFMGALDTGIVSPARGVIQSQLGVNETVGIWMITIFTLAYAASIPISGKLADRIGSKTMYIISITLFGLGSLICSISAFTGGFQMLLAGRVIQALGGGGIMPIVTAEIGTSFPIEKRGMALGLVGGVYGIANILGSSAGSAILGIVGNSGWHWLFLINVPISIFIIVGSIFALENHKSSTIKKMDFKGTIILSGMIIPLMYGLTNIKFNDFVNSISSIGVYPYILVFAILMPIFVVIEKKAQDPILNLKYFSDRNMMITFITATLVGVSLMGMVFVPQFAENALKIKTGAGGYFVTALGLFAGIGAPLSGRLVDKYGAKIVLMSGFSFTLLGGLFLAFVATSTLSIIAVLVGLFLMGLGMGFTMGTPLNYMILKSVPGNESNSALATLSLVRSIGTVLSPALMIGFLATAGVAVQDNLMDTLPQPPTRLEMKQVEEIKPLLAKIKADPELSKKVDPKMLDIDKMMSNNSASFDMNSRKSSLPDSIIKDLQSADVTNITDRVKKMADRMFTDNVTPKVIKSAVDGVQNGIDGMNTGLSEMEKAKSTLKSNIAKLEASKVKLTNGIASLDKAKSGIYNGINGISLGIDKMSKGLSNQKLALSNLKGILDKMNSIPASFNPTKVFVIPPAGMPPMDKSKLENNIKKLESGIQGLQTKIDSSILQKNALQNKILSITSTQTKMGTAISQMTKAQSGMDKGIAKLSKSTALLKKTVYKMTEIRDALPMAFEASKTAYLGKLESLRPQIDHTFQSGLNKGFRQMYIMVSILSFLAIIVLAFYKNENELELENKA